MTHTYPHDLVPFIKAAWAKKTTKYEEKRPPLPPDSALVELLDLVYHTSLLREEGRKLSFRILLLQRESSKQEVQARRQNSRIAEFAEDRDLSIAELRRLAPAADSIRTMICVDYNNKSGWRVWGLLDTGLNWWQFTRHEASSGSPPPVNLAVGSPGPGEITISSGGRVLLSLRSGSTYQPHGSPLHSGPISDHLEPSRKKLYNQVIRQLKVKKYDSEGHDNDYPKNFHDMCLSRILTAIRELSHGGTLIVVPDTLSTNDSRLTDRITIKHPCNYDYIWGLMIRHLELHRKYYDMYFPLWDSEKSIDPKDFQTISMLDRERDEADEFLSDSIHFLASLSSVDGALVMTDRFRTLGFGAEVIAQSPTLREVYLAENATATKTRPISIESYGTRHRSAFRFCSSYEDSIAFIVSSDGGIKATKRIGSTVVMWPEVQPGIFGF